MRKPIYLSGQKKLYRQVSTVIDGFVRIKYSWDAESFQRLHNPDGLSDYSEWVKNRKRANMYDSCRKFIHNLAEKFGFDTHEEMYLENILFYYQNPNFKEHPIIMIENGSDQVCAPKSDKKHKTRQWDTAFAFHQIQEIMDSGENKQPSYKDIVKELRKRAPKGFKKKITSDRLRKIYSRGNRIITENV